MDWEIISWIVVGVGYGIYRLTQIIPRGNKLIRDVLIQILHDTGARRVMIVSIHGRTRLKILYDQRINGYADIKSQEVFVLRDHRNRIKYELKIQWTDMRLMDKLDTDKLRESINKIEELL